MAKERVTRADIIHLQEQIDSIRALIQQTQEIIQATYATRTYVQTYTEHILGEMMPIQDPYTENTKIAGYVPLDIDRLLRHFANLGGSYTFWDYRVIITQYDMSMKLANLNPYLLIAQMVKETDWCRSWWSQRPRRNPAGIGVTGEVQKEEPLNKDAWAYRIEDQVWVKGYSFTSWQVSSQAHAGHMLAYLYKDKELDESQEYFVAVDPRAKFIPEKWRGSVKVLKDLDGKWAVPGIGYGKSIATIANVLRT